MVNNPTQYSRWDIARAALVLGGRPMRLPREARAERLELGEGVIRSVLDALKRKRFIASTRRGHALTANGERGFRGMVELLTPPRAVTVPLYPNFHCAAVVIRPPHAREVGAEERDLAVKEGAEGAILLIQRKGKLELPGFRYPARFVDVQHQLRTADGDLTIISFAEDRRRAENAVLRIAESVSHSLEKQFREFQ